MILKSRNLTTSKGSYMIFYALTLKLCSKTFNICINFCYSHRIYLWNKQNPSVLKYFLYALICNIQNSNSKQNMDSISNQINRVLRIQRGSIVVIRIKYKFTDSFAKNLSIIVINIKKQNMCLNCFNSLKLLIFLHGNVYSLIKMFFFLNKTNCF